MTVPEWYGQASCRGMNPDLFFPRWGNLPPEAAATCRVCPVKAACLEAGNDEAYGTWGGVSELDRRRWQRTAVCVVCGTEFSFARKPGSPRRYCSRRCGAEAHRVRYRKTDGYLRERGHGLISRYNAGCRCGPCRVAAREARRRIRANSSQVFRGIAPQRTAGRISA